eukprot:4005649-Amphidinium_carterae.1
MEASRNAASVCVCVCVLLGAFLLLQEMKKGAKYYVAMENGIFQVQVDGEPRYFDLAWVAIAAPELGAPQQRNENKCQSKSAVKCPGAAHSEHRFERFMGCVSNSLMAKL